MMASQVGPLLCVEACLDHSTKIFGCVGKSADLSSFLFCTCLCTIASMADSKKHDLTASDDKAATLLRVASYLGRPQKFMPIANARAEMRRTLDLVSKGSVVLTTHGEPAASVVPFTTLEDMRRALMHLLIEEMDSSLARSKKRVRAQSDDTFVSSEEELQELVGEAVKRARSGKSSRRRTPRR